MKVKKGATRALAAGLGVAALSLACGYGLSAGAGRMPHGAERVFVRPFENRSTDAEAGALVATAVRQELARRGEEGGSGSPARIEGTVENTIFAPVGQNPPIYQLTLVVMAHLLVNDKVLAEQRFSHPEFSPSGIDPLESEGRRNLALRRAASAIARDIVERFETP